MNKYARNCYIQIKWKSKLKYVITKFFQLKLVILLFDIKLQIYHVRTGFLQLKTQGSRKARKKTNLKTFRKFRHKFPYITDIYVFQKLAELLFSETALRRC